MKILHTSDWHLGRMIYGRSLMEDQAYFVEQVYFPALEQYHPDCVILAGDIFDRQIASVEAIRMFGRVLTRMHGMGIPLIAVAGNHDGADRLAVGTDLLRHSGIHLLTSPDALQETVRLDCGGERVDIYGMPYCDPAGIRQFLGQEDLHGFDAAYRAVLEPVRAKLDPQAYSILVAHCFVAGSQTSDSESAVYVGGSGEVHTDVFEGFDYVALGHLHRAQRAGKQGWYSGSPLKYSFDEESHKKSMALLTIENGTCSTELLPVTPLRDMRTLDGTMEELLELGRQQRQEDYLWVRVKGKTPVYMPAEQLRPYYPNLLGIHCEWLQQDSELETETGRLREQLIGRRIDEKMVLNEFFRQVCGTEATEEEEELFLEIFGQVQAEQEEP